MVQQAQTAAQQTKASVEQKFKAWYAHVQALRKGTPTDTPKKPYHDRSAGCGLEMLGVLIMVRPSGAAVQYVAILPLISALGYAGTQLMTRRLGVTDGASTMSFYIQLTLLAASAVMGLAVGDGRFAGGGQANMEFLLRAWIVPTPGDLALFAASGFTVAIGGFAISQAYRLVAATTVAPFEYLALPFEVLWGYLIWGDFPDLFTFLGIALIVVGGLTVILRSRAVA